MAVNIKAKFKKADGKYNGLDAIAKKLLDDPMQEHYIIAKVRVTRIVEDVEGGGVLTPTIGLHHIEVMESSREEQAARKLFENACKLRLGDLPQQALPGMGEPGADDADGAEGGKPADDGASTD